MLNSAEPSDYVSILVPSRAKVQVLLPEDAVHLYHCLSWVRPTASDLELDVTLPWAATRGRWVDRGMRVTAHSNGDVVARAEFVVRSTAGVTPFGVGSLPPPPSPGRGAVLARTRFEDEEIVKFADRIRAWPDVHVDPVRCRGLGYPGLMVQGLLLLSRFMDECVTHTAGCVEIWFRQPVFSGYEIELLHHPDGIGSIRLASSENVAALTKLSSARLQPDGDEAPRLRHGTGGRGWQ